MRLSELWTDEVSGRKKRRDALSPDKKRRRPSVVSDILPLLIILCFFVFTATTVYICSSIRVLYLCASSSAVLNFVHDHISSICCLIWIFWRTGQLSERCVCVLCVFVKDLNWPICLCACSKNVDCVTPTIRLLMTPSVWKNSGGCCVSGRGHAGPPQREGWLRQLRVPLPDRPQQIYSQLLRRTDRPATRANTLQLTSLSTHTHAHTRKHTVITYSHNPLHSLARGTSW